MFDVALRNKIITLVGGQVNVFAGVDKVGFSVSTFSDLLGRMCWDSLVPTLDGIRIYINDAIRYLTYNPVTTPATNQPNPTSSNQRLEQASTAGSDICRQNST